ncbi:hypothetical protein TSOC_008410 [Tetrabaena socialis]|uniref:FHA domain-containing protein n=1 Tax=Tetrabaena socialis TaxID=47790 RepID=A0A2J7ZYJ5_9CHLO|nr:hypothetical protein TSOC_008410 [Tetrabaena socialis]|eukprot:PNH05342.1 hypothetical protein TSOC_008410 [Tetrabaena socialis]
MDVSCEAAAAVEAMAVPPRLRLVCTDGPCAGQTFDTDSLKSFCFTIGRVKKAKMYMKDQAVSEKHAEVSWNGLSWTLRDVGSSNGSRVNGAKLQPYRVHVLQAGEHVTFGTHTIATVELEERTLRDVTVEQLLRAYFESRCQAMEEASTQAALDMAQRCHRSLDALLLAEPAQA